MSRVQGWCASVVAYLKYYPVIVVSAGESGIAMASQLKQQLDGFDQFRIFDRQSGLGGIHGGSIDTWVLLVTC